MAKFLINYCFQRSDFRSCFGQSDFRCSDISNFLFNVLTLRCSDFRRFFQLCTLVAIFTAVTVSNCFYSRTVFVSLFMVSTALKLFFAVVHFLFQCLLFWQFQNCFSQSYTFGYKRAEILGALLSIVTIWYVTWVLLYLVIFIQLLF